MVTEVDELRRARALLEREIEHMRRHGHEQPTRVHLGSMVEVPQLLFQLDELMAEADFISVGSNDLLQFMTASDRSNTNVAGRFDILSRPFLRALRSIVRAADKAGTPITLCGEMAGRPIGAMALAAIGYRSLSMSPAAIGPVKQMILSLDLEKLATQVEAALDSTEGEDVLRGALAAFAEAEDVPL